MKNFLSLAICIFSIHAGAEVLVNDLLRPVQFKFKQDIILAPSEDRSNNISAGVKFNEIFDPSTFGWKELKISPGSSVMDNMSTCVLQKEVSADSKRTARIQANHNEWTIQLKKRERVKSNTPGSKFVFGVPGMAQYSLSFYDEEFELTNKDGVKVQLICKQARCVEAKGSLVKNRITCDETISTSTTKILQGFGIETISNLEEVPAQRNKILRVKTAQ